MSSTWARAASSVRPAPSMLRSMILPTRTPLTPSKPRLGSERSTAAPWGSRMPCLGVT